MKRKALTITLAAVMAMGTCAVTASAADGDTYTHRYLPACTARSTGCSNTGIQG